MAINDNNDYSALYDKYHNKIYKYCFKKLNSDHYNAEYITADVFLILFQKWDNIDINNNIGAWLRDVADNCIMRYYSKNREYEPFDELNDATLPDSMKTSYLEDEYDYKEYIDRICKNLTEEQQLIFNYRFVDDMNLSEISKILKIPYSTVRFKIEEIKKIAKEIIENNN